MLLTEGFLGRLSRFKLIRRRRISLKRDNHPKNPSIAKLKSILKLIFIVILYNEFRTNC